MKPILTTFGDENTPLTEIEAGLINSRPGIQGLMLMNRMRIQLNIYIVLLNFDFLNRNKLLKLYFDGALLSSL